MNPLEPNSYPYLIYHRIDITGAASIIQSIQIPRGKDYFLDKILVSNQSEGDPGVFSTPRLQLLNYSDSWEKLHQDPPPIPLFATPGAGGAAAQYLNASKVKWPFLFKGVFQLRVSDFNPAVVTDFIDILLVGRAIKNRVNVL